MGFGEILHWWTLPCAGHPMEVPQLHTGRASCTRNPSRLYPIYCFIWLFIYILYILHNKPVNVSVSLNSMRSSQTWGEGHGNPWFMASRSDIKMTTWDFWLVSKGNRGRQEFSFSSVWLINSVHKYSLHALLCQVLCWTLGIQRWPNQRPYPQGACLLSSG